jgi:hypothetical protein
MPNRSHTIAWAVPQNHTMFAILSISWLLDSYCTVLTNKERKRINYEAYCMEDVTLRYCPFNAQQARCISRL